MGIAPFFDCVVAAQDAEVGCFKPNPRILEVALGKLGIAPSDALFAGDRPDGDGVAAARAGVRYVNIVHAPSPLGVPIDGLLASLRKRLISARRVRHALPWTIVPEVIDILSAAARDAATIVTANRLTGA